MKNAKFDAALALALGHISEDWFRVLNDDPNSLRHLRKALTPIEAISAPAAIALLRRLDKRFNVIGTPGEKRALEVVGYFAMVAAMVKKATPSALWAGAAPNMMKGLAGSSSSGRLLSPLRFQRLMKARDMALVKELRSCVYLLGRQAPVGEIAMAIADWSDERRRAWAFAYYDAGFEEQAA